MFGECWECWFDEGASTIPYHSLRLKQFSTQMLHQEKCKLEVLRELREVLVKWFSCWFHHWNHPALSLSVHSGRQKKSASACLISPHFLDPRILLFAFVSVPLKFFTFLLLSFIAAGDTVYIIFVHAAKLSIVTFLATTDQWTNGIRVFDCSASSFVMQQ